MNLLKGKTIVILYETQEMYETACVLYKNLAAQGIISVFVLDKETLSLIENSGYDLRYVFLYDGKEVPKKEDKESIYHLYDVTQPYNYWLEHTDENYDKVISYFESVEEELQA